MLPRAGSSPAFRTARNRPAGAQNGVCGLFSVVYRESRSLQRDAPKRIENYESLQRLERRLTDRHEELTEAQKRAHNRMMMFRALVNVLMQKAGQYDLKGDDQLKRSSQETTPMQIPPKLT